MDGRSQRSRSGQAMFTQPNSQTPFSKLRFDVDSLYAPLASGGGAGRREGQEGLRFGLPADPMLDDVLRSVPVMPDSLEARLHSLVDQWADGGQA
ncbi:hypothetical protein NG895_16705 [Aeoliella sp. ICT_H6.2]|uniref:Uncharacterized protein n=1 Tax=Aeoliella straminimaris TaxID=2954799 RepID=A0A9X2JJY6_9BACT|nr:hypothetical protein [Aeoliella straminimaris]MCO6045554.1 hypothetical protein [Aeoliella straminimaris]